MDVDKTTPEKKLIPEHCDKVDSCRYRVITGDRFAMGKLNYVLMINLLRPLSALHERISNINFDR